jgi:3-phosphoinositide dependent protein kinase-1
MMAKQEKIVTPTREETETKMETEGAIRNTNNHVNKASTADSNNSSSTQQHKPSPKDFIAVKIIGEGSFSTVFKVRLVRDPRKVFACKICSKDKIRREKKVDAVFRERDVMNILLKHKSSSSPFFIQLCWTFHDSAKLYFVMNYAKNGELLSFIKPPGVNRDITTFYAAEIVKALEHLHSLGIVHRDLKPENILLNERMHIQITDFGSAKIENQDLLASVSSATTTPTPSIPQSSPSKRPVSPPQIGGTNGRPHQQQSSSQPPFNRRKSFVGTAQYVSPEMLSSKQACKASDIWALGCIVYQMRCGSFPFHGKGEYLTFKAILNLEYTFPDNFDPVVRNFVECILKIEPEDRLGVRDFDEKVGIYEGIRGHELFKGMEGRWNNLHEEIPPLAPNRQDDEDEEEELNITEPGFDERTIARLEVLNEDNRRERSYVSNHLIPDANDPEFKRKLEKQRKENIYDSFVEGNLIIYQGLIDKWKGILARRRERMFLLTTGPHLYYVDPKDKVLKGQVPISSETRLEAKNFKTFYIHTVSYFCYKLINVYYYVRSR